MGSQRKQAREARAQAEEAAAEARSLRQTALQKEQEERIKVQKKLIRGIRGRLNPFEVLPQPANTLGGSGSLGGES